MPPSDADTPSLAEQIADRDLLIDAVRAAGPIALSKFRLGGETQAAAWEKEAGQGLLTEADLAVNDALRETLQAARPGYGWLSEEDDDSAARRSAERLFVVDPIDGTRSFAEGKPEFCLSVAVVAGGRPVAGAVFAPALDALYDAVLDGPARKNGAPIQASRRETLEGAAIISAARHLKPDRWPGGAPPIDRRYVHPIAYRLCAVAEGMYDGMLTLTPTHEWDIAAGDLIARRAGAATTDRDGAPFAYNNAVPRIPSVISAAPALHAELVRRLGAGS